jgi:ATP-dependent DNA helicase RecQ
MSGKRHAMYDVVSGVFGYDNIRKHQEEAVNAALDERNILLNLGPGGGTSLCYQLPALLSDGLTVVILPLISEITNETNELSKIGVEYTLNIEQDITKYEKTKLLYITPEQTVQDVISSFGVDAEKITPITNNFERPNLTLEVMPKKDNAQEIVDYVTDKKLNEKTGVIVCLSKLDCEKVFEKLSESGFASTLYHASLSSEERKQNMSNWIDGTVKIVIGTVALGVPKRKEPVQFIIYYKLPRSLEEYFVLNGIVGRNGEDCTSVIMYNNASFEKMQMMLQGMNDTELKKMNEYCKNVTICRHQVLYSHFERVVDKCGSRCDVCQQDKS